MEQQQSNNKAMTSRRKVVGILSLAVVGMFGFGFALVPLYNVFCQVTGLNGKTGGKTEYTTAAAQIDTSRVITVQFMASNNANMNWAFHAVDHHVEVHPGELKEIKFYARNPNADAMIAQAVPSVAPSEAADYLHKTECFCFTQQRLEGGEQVEMPVIFFLDQDIPQEITKLTLTYTIFDVTANFANAGSTVSAR